MFVTLVHVSVIPSGIPTYLKSMRANQEASIREPGNVRFDLLQASGDPTRFVVYEAYESEDAARRHKETSHYLRCRDEIAPLMAKPRRSEIFVGLLPRTRAGVGVRTADSLVDAPAEEAPLDIG